MSPQRATSKVVVLLLSVFILAANGIQARGDDQGIILSADTRSGEIPSAGYADVYHFSGEAGNTVIIKMFMSYYSQIDLYDPDGILETVG